MPKGLQNRLVVQLPPALAARVTAYHQRNGLQGTPQDSARELITAALEYPEVEASLLRSARQRAFGLVKRQLYERVQVFMDELGSEWARALASFDDEALLRSVSGEGEGYEQQKLESGPR